ncbi:hypothetical protein A5881_003626 [Enterococcus termitis]
MNVKNAGSTQGELNSNLTLASDFQKQMWTMQMLDEQNAAYNTYTAFKFDKGFKKKDFVLALKELHQNHDILQMQFIESDGQIYAKKNYSAALRVKITEDYFAKEEEILEEIYNENKKVFDFSRETLYKILVYRYENEQTIVYLKFHHILLDEYGLSLYLTQLFKLYNKFSDFKLLPSSYFDINDSLAEDEEQEVLANWLEKLRDRKFSLEWEKKKLLKEQTFIYEFEADCEVRNQVLGFASTERKPVFVVLLSWFIATLLKIETPQNFSVGIPVSNRNTVEKESTIGPFSSTLPLIVDYSKNLTYGQLLDQVTNEYYFLLENRMISSQKLINTLNFEERSLSSTLFNVLFTELKPLISEQVSFPEKIKLYPNTNKFDLSFFYQLNADSLEFSIEYDNEKFDTNYFTNFKKVFLSSLKEMQFFEEKVITSPVLESNVFCKYKNNKILVTEFINSSEKYDSNIALTYNNHDISYFKLNQLVEDLYIKIKELGLPTQSKIGVYLDRGIESIVSILAIFKARCIYVPIDKQLPIKRIEYIVEDSGMRGVITDNYDNLPDFSPSNTKIIEYHKPSDVSLRKVTDEIEEYQSEDILYQLYTSGSTGTPKGVAITNRNISPFVEWNKDFFSFTDKDRNVQYHNLSFDFSIWEIFETLLSGGRLYIVEDKISKNTELFLDFLYKNKISVLNMTPSQMTQIVDYAETFSKELPYLRTLVLGGEQFSMNLGEKLKNLLPNECRIYNEYGPTEATISCSIFEFKNEMNLASVPIGNPTSNFEFLILNENMNESKKGELYLSGDGIADGYTNNKSETNKRFIPLNGTLYYRTGDLVEKLDNGQYVFLGRADNQVKYQGYRIELSEIENEILKITDCTNCTVHMEKDNQYNLDNLVAYLVISGEKEFSDNEIKNKLSKKLPSYMIPNKFVIIDEITTTVNGKLNSKSKDKISSLSEQLEGIFLKILNIQSIQEKDNFFGLGGDSIKAIRVAIEAKKLGIHLTTSSIFETPIIKSLIANLIKEGQIKDSTSYLPNVNEVPYYELSDIQKGMLWESMTSKVTNVYHQQMIIDIDHNIIFEKLNSSIVAMMKKIPQLRNRVYFDKDENPVQEQGYLKDTYLENFTSEEIGFEDLLESDFKKEFFFPSDDLIRFYLWSADNGFKLIISYHHLLLDGWSSAYIVKFLFDDYFNTKKVKNEAKDNYPDYFRSHLSEMKSKDRTKALNYWSKYVQNFPAIKRQQLENANSAFTESIILSPADTEKIIALSNRNNISPNIVFLAAYIILQSKVKKNHSPAIGVTNSGRQYLSADNIDLVGCLLNTLPMTVDLQNINDINLLFKTCSEFVKNTVLYGFVSLNEIMNLLPKSDDQSLFTDIFVFQDYLSNDYGFEKHNIRNIDFRAGINYSSSFIVELTNKTAIGMMFNDELEREDKKNQLEEYKSILFSFLSDSFPNEYGTDNSIKIENMVRKAWLEILKLENLSNDDNFFEIGGDSISSLRIALRLKKNGYNVDPTIFFDYQTIDSVVEFLNK